MDIQTFQARLNEWGKSRTPFVFIVDFELAKPMAWPVAELDTADVLFDLNGKTNSRHAASGHVDLDPTPVSFEKYRTQFDLVMAGLLRGDSFLTNLTITTPVRINKSLEELYYISKAKYKLMLRDSFLVFSPETFIQIESGVIRTFPMKGTIDADVDNARDRILANRKEMAEHITIVDLLRNDISVVANNVEVKRFRFVEAVRTHRGALLQVSSEICGTILPEFRNELGTLLLSLLPAGSVTGAPKTQTMKIISTAEQEKRGYYTGVCGHFDGKKFDSAVMIRFIEQRDGELFFRSGGGITTQSTAEEEYKEALDKIYVQVF